jgi:urease accessory protein
MARDASADARTGAIHSPFIKENVMRRILIGTILTTAFAVPASAHPLLGSEVSFAAGMAHPFGGLDHIAVMMAVGLWAVLKGRHALWLWPATFIVVMLVGGAVGLAHVSLPLVEPGVLASVVVLGLMVALAIDLPLWSGAAIIAVFALLHGHAHGTEVANAVDGPAYMAGFALATTMLLALGIGLGQALQRGAAGPANRLAGAICVAVGVGLCTGVL